MPPREGLPGLDGSIPFSPDPLHHLFIVIHGAGDPYVDQQPWLTSLESSLTQLHRNYILIADKQNRRRRGKPSFPSVLFLPVEWHCPAFETWQAEVRHADPRPALPGGPTTVREAVAETLGDILLVASPFWRETIATYVAKQIAEQVAAVRRNRPAFTGRVSLLVHSVGAMLAVELLDGDRLGELQLDSVMFAGCPIPAYAALAPDGGRQKALMIVRERRKEIRFINVFHPLDPVAYRLEPFVEEREVRAAIQVKPQRRTFWDDAGEFWDDVVYSLWATLFPGGMQRGAEVSRVADLFSMFGGRNHGTARRGRTGVVGARREEGGIRRSSSYMVPAEKEVNEIEGEEEREFWTGGSEVLLSDRIDYELQDGMGVPPFDVMASWGAIKAHTYYWQSMDVAQILMDIAVTSDDAMASR